MALSYKLEYVFDDTRPSDSSVYIHLRENPPRYMPHIDKEDYDILEDDEKHEFLDSLFNIAGVTELSSRAYRLWIMKSPSYNWREVLEPVLAYLASYFGESGYESQPGSANVDGTGFTVATTKNRRKL